MSTSHSYILWGASGHAKVLAEAIYLNSGKVIALFDNQKIDSPLIDVPVFKGVIGFQSWLETQKEASRISGLAAIGGGRGNDRIEIHQMFLDSDICVPRLIHPTAYVSPSAAVGLGTQVLAMANVAAGVYLGNSCIVNHHASIDHECVVGDGTHVAPGATLCGCVIAERNVFIGAGAVILPRLRLGENCVVGAGAVVTRDVPSGATVVGNPAKVIRND
jgi:sugar O-acyltransferase (sialic acid O-acetyltransferase NeuD family)